MQILLANAKIMFGSSETKPLTEPLFQSIANRPGSFKGWSEAG